MLDSKGSEIIVPQLSITRLAFFSTYPTMMIDHMMEDRKTQVSSDQHRHLLSIWMVNAEIDWYLEKLTDATLPVRPVVD